MLRFTVVPASYVFLLREGPLGTEVLLQLRAGTGYMDGYWAAGVAGHVEKGETVYDAAAREAREEVGVADIELVPWCAMQRTAGGMGLSSERRGQDLEGVEGTGSTGTSVTEATGTDEDPAKSLEDPEWKGE